MPRNSSKTKAGILARKWQCYWCNVKLTLASNKEGQAAPDNLLTRDHLLPQSMGGRNGWKGNNLALACHMCNNSRQVDLRWVPFSALRPGIVVPKKQLAILNHRGVNTERFISC